jgi:ubiquinone/menaquinone biosynthesis C-methylase UbiE
VSTSPDAPFDRFAAREPYFSILTDPRFLRTRLTPDTEREFFASGEAVASWMLHVIDAGLSPQFAPMSILEYGCGVGRLALPFASRPGSVTAVDRSPVMLDLARKEANRRGLGHIVFQTPDELFASPRTFDLVVCYHVLQRLGREEALALMRRLVGLVGSGGVGVFQWPYRTSDSALVTASRWARERLPGVNALVNATRRKPADTPFIPTHTLDLDDGLAVLDVADIGSTHVALERHQMLDYAVAFAHRSDRPSMVRAAITSRGITDVGQGLSRVGQGFSPDATDAEIDAFNRAAEAYFASLPDWAHHLAKPFSQIDETPTLLASAAVLLQALRLAPGMTVLEFGAGSGWLSRFLTQMGCRVILLDVSSTALRLARELYRRQPVIAEPGSERPDPTFLEYDGRRIALPDASVDRIVCFDAFHHAANPHAVIGDFARVLTDGGIAAFVEPGPRHAEAPRSQFESHTYGVVERDVDVHDIWRTASASGFSDMRMCVFHAPPYHVSLDEYEDLVAGGRAEDAWMASTRTFLRHVRSFYLVKQGTARVDSRSATGLACDIRASIAGPASGASGIAIEVVVTNTGAATWLPSGTTPGGVSLGAHLYDESGALRSFNFHTWPLTHPSREIAPGEAVTCRLTLPSLPPGPHRVELDCVADRVTWFAQAGSRTVTLTVTVVR